MYVAPAFRETDVAALHAAIEHIRFGTLATVSLEGPVLSHLPMFVDPEPAPYGTIHGHVARANPQWQRTDPAQSAVAAFVGPSFYVTPAWYPTKRATGKVVPTWDYVAVQARGQLAFFDDADRLLALVTELTRRQEALRAEPWHVTDAPAEYVAQMLRAIVGFELRVDALVGSWKLGQNKGEGDRRGVAEAVAACIDDPAVQALLPRMRPA